MGKDKPTGSVESLLEGCGLSSGSAGPSVSWPPTKPQPEGMRIEWRDGVPHATADVLLCDEARDFYATHSEGGAIHCPECGESMGVTIGDHPLELLSVNCHGCRYERVFVAPDTERF